jgi:FHS family L-fucose permease-like MFS transporter
MLSGFNSHIKKSALAGLLFLFFLWGGLTCLNTILFPYLERLFVFKNSPYFGFSNVFFGSYFIMAIPAALLIRTLNYKISIMLGLLISAMGTVFFIFASKYISFSLFIAGFVILASGITIIQVAANTYVGLLGELNFAAGRLSLAQAINSSGYVIVLMLTINPVFTGYDSIVYNARMIQQPYLIITILIVITLLAYNQLHFPNIHRHSDKAWFSGKPAFYLSALGIFFYVGVELTISRIIQYSHPAIHSYSFISVMLLCYWGGMMIGRFAGFGLFQRFSPQLILLINGLCAVILLIISIFNIPASLWLLLPTGFLNGIIFPVFFASGLQQSKHPSYFDGALLVMAISGGAIIPLLYNYFSTYYSTAIALFLILLCYLIITITGLFQNKTQNIPPSEMVVDIK